MAGEEYAVVSAGGKLKLKGSKVKDGRVDKSKKKKKQLKDTLEGKGDTTVTTTTTKTTPEDEGEEDQEFLDKKSTPEDGEPDEKRVIYKTDAERRYEEKRRKRLNERLQREGVKTHKERVEELNRYLSTLSEHHDMPKIGPG